MLSVVPSGVIRAQKRAGWVAGSRFARPAMVEGGEKRRRVIRAPTRAGWVAGSRFARPAMVN